MPKVSIIVPNYNYARFLPERMESIFSQTYQDYEVILLDDCSTDDSRELLTEYAKHEKITHCIFNEQNSGSPFEQWHKGVMLARGEWIWIAEADDVADSRFLEEIIQGIEKRPTVGLAYSHLKTIDTNGNDLWSQEETVNKFYTGSEFIRQKLVFTTTIFNVSSCIFRKSDYENIDESHYQQFRHGGDWMFYIQMAGVTDVYECGLVLDHFRQHPYSTTKLTTTQDYINESFPILLYLLNHNKISQCKYALNYARLEYQKNYNRKELYKVLTSYLKIGIFLVPIYYIVYFLYKRFFSLFKYNDR